MSVFMGNPLVTVLRVFPAVILWEPPSKTGVFIILMMAVTIGKSFCLREIISRSDFHNPGVNPIG
jgi:hypothetical protein